MGMHRQQQAWTSCLTVSQSPAHTLCWPLTSLTAAVFSAPGHWCSTSCYRVTGCYSSGLHSICLHTQLLAEPTLGFCQSSALAIEMAYTTSVRLQCFTYVLLHPFALLPWPSWLQPTCCRSCIAHTCLCSSVTQSIKLLPHDFVNTDLQCCARPVCSGQPGQCTSWIPRSAAGCDITLFRRCAWPPSRWALLLLCLHASIVQADLVILAGSPSGSTQ